MAHSISAKKRVRQNIKHRARNRARKDVLKGKVKSFAAALTAGDANTADTELRGVSASLDRMAARGSLHKHTAARKRSRLAKRLNAMRAGPKPGTVTKPPGKTGKGTKAATA